MKMTLTDHDEKRHPMHLCSLVERGQMALVAQLTKDPHYVCGLCGRVATSGENLCDPILQGGSSLGDPRPWEGLEGPDTPPPGLADHDESAHHLHLCQLVQNRLMARVARSARNAKYICRTCGRAAASAESLCYPVAF